MKPSFRYNVGDLVLVKNSCSSQYFAGKLAIIIKQMGLDPMDVVGGFYYEMHVLVTQKNHVFNHIELELLSSSL